MNSTSSQIPQLMNSCRKRHRTGQPVCTALLRLLEAHAGRVATILLVCQSSLLAWSAARHCPTVDEVAHLPAGINIWHNGRFDLYSVNPPLVKMLAAMPVVLGDPKTNWTGWNQRPGGRSEWIVGRDFFLANKQQTFRYFTWARWACLPLIWMGGWICFVWSREWFGPLAGLLTVTLWSVSPNVLGNAAMITPDAGAAATGVLAAYLFWRWLSHGGWQTAGLAGLGMGLALLTKTTWILLFGLWPLLTLWWMASRVRPLSTRRIMHQVAQLVFLQLTGLYVLNLGYGFDGTGRRLGDFAFVSKSLAGAEVFDLERMRTGNRFQGRLLGHLPMPVPAPYLQGIDLQKHDFEAGKLCYLRGEFKDGGWWYFYLYALLIKTPIGFLLLAGYVSWIRFRNCDPELWRRDVILLAPACLLVAVVSAETGFTIFLRYVLPALPFLFIWIGQAAELARRNGALGGWFVLGCLIWAVNHSVYHHPHSLSYFNELVGGPRGGGAHLLDGNLDWGQDLLQLKDWLSLHPEARPLQLAYYGQVNPRHAAIDFTHPAPAPAAHPFQEWLARDQAWRRQVAQLQSEIAARTDATGWVPPATLWSTPCVDQVQIHVSQDSERLPGSAEPRYQILPDQTICLRPPHPEQLTCTVHFATTVSQVTALRLSVLPDLGRKSRAIGAAENGNFVLNNLQLQVRAADGRVLRQATWSHARTDWEHPGFPVAAAIDDNLNSGWSVLPRVSDIRTATFLLAEPLSLQPGDKLAVRLQQTWGRRHVFTQFRLAVADSPLSSDTWCEECLQPAGRMSTEQRTRREQLLAASPEPLRGLYRELIELGAARPDPPADLSGAWLAPGWYAISANFLMGYPGKGWTGDGRLQTFERSAFADFRHLTPLRSIGYSIYLYYVTAEDSARLRARHGLPPCTDPLALPVPAAAAEG